MFRSRAQILAHGQNFTAHLAQIVHRLKEFRLFFAQAEHHAALGDNTRSEFLRPAQNSQGRPILRARAHQRCQAFDRFHVVIVNVRASIEHDLDAPILRVKIGNKHFDDDGRIHLADRYDRASKMIGATVPEIVARNRRDHDVF